MKKRPACSQQPQEERGLKLAPQNNVFSQAGRLLFVAQKSTNVGNVVFYSDDGAKTFVKSTTVIEHCNEAQMVELADGSILLVTPHHASLLR